MLQNTVPAPSEKLVIVMMVRVDCAYVVEYPKRWIYLKKYPNFFFDWSYLESVFLEYVILIYTTQGNSAFHAL